MCRPCFLFFVLMLLLLLLFGSCSSHEQLSLEERLFQHLFNQQNRRQQEQEQPIQTNTLFLRGGSGNGQQQEEDDIRPKGEPLSTVAAHNDNDDDQPPPQEEERAGLVEMSHSFAWNQSQLKIQLLQNEDRFTFQQDAFDQPIPDIFIGKDATNQNTITLLKTNVTLEQIPIITGTCVLANGTIYRLRQTTTTTHNNNTPQEPQLLIVEEQTRYDPEYEYETYETQTETEDNDNDNSLVSTTTIPASTLFVPQQPWNITTTTTTNNSVVSPPTTTTTLLESTLFVPQQQPWNITTTPNHPIYKLLFDPGDMEDNNSTAEEPPLRHLAQADDGSVLDVLVIYTQRAMCAAAGYRGTGSCPRTSSNQANIEGIVRLAIEEANVAFSNSNIQTRLRLVHVHFDTTYDEEQETVSWGKVVSHLGRSRDGNLDYVHAMRDQYGADFTSMFIEKRGYCGAGFRSDTPNAGQAFSVVRWSCATGHYSFAHELAHNMGCQHNRQATTTTTTTTVGGAALTGYNYGYDRSTGIQSSRFRTVMSYNCPNGGCPRVQYFSTPNRRYLGIPVGTPTEDNARWIQERLRIYGNFRKTRVVRYSTPTLPVPTHVSSGNSINSVSAGTKQLSTLRTTQQQQQTRLVGAPGNAFDLTAKNNQVIITNFAVTAYASTTVTVEVFKKKMTGEMRGTSRNENSWTLIGVATFLTYENTPTMLPADTFSPVTIPAGETQAFYITFHESTNYNTYVRGTTYGDVYSENNDLQFKVGLGVDYKFGQTYYARVFTGTIFYETILEQPVNLGVGGSVATPPSASGVSKKTFTTTFRAGSGQAGNMFTIENHNSRDEIIIEAFDVNVMLKDRNVPIEIYTRSGEFSGHEHDTIGWIKICDTTVIGKGTGVATPIPKEDILSVRMPPNTIRSFYITSTAPVIRYSPESISSGSSSNSYSDGNIQLKDSIGMKYPFGKQFSNRLWNGNIYYQV